MSPFSCHLHSGLRAMEEADHDSTAEPDVVSKVIPHAASGRPNNPAAGRDLQYLSIKNARQFAARTLQFRR